MTKIVGVRFQRASKIYYFDPGEWDLDMAMHVIVETARGMELGTVLIPPKEVEEDSIVSPLKPVIRVATDEDERLLEYNKGREQEAFVICKQKIREHELEMKLVGAEYTFDGSKLLFYFTADGRIDFRELVKDLASVFRTRIELRQIGVRDETKILGGIGICGRPLCCSTWMADFIPVSIKMAKEQNLSLNPTKISGVCGRLMCCLKNEQDTYEYLNAQMPNMGDMVTANDGVRGQVCGLNVLRQTVKIVVDNGSEKEMKEYPVKDLNGGHAHHRKDVHLTEEELNELGGLEDGEENPSRPEKNSRSRRDRRRDGEGGENRRSRDGENRENRENRRRDGENGENRENRRRNRDGENGENRENRRRDGENRRRDGENGENRENRRRDGENGENRENRRRRRPRPHGEQNTEGYSNGQEESQNGPQDGPQSDS